MNDAEVVFPQSTLTDSGHGRTIRRQGSLPGFTVLNDCQEYQIDIQSSTEDFKKAFEYMSDGLLKDLDWTNVFVAGGMALGTLLAVGPPAQNNNDRWDASDIDIYIHGLSPAEATAKVYSIYNTFRSNALPENAPTLAVKNSKTITFYIRYPTRRIQIVLKLVESPKDVLLNFDLDICAIGWDGSEVWMLPRAARALESLSAFIPAFILT